MKTHSTVKNWVFYTIVIAFALYWLSNLVLWFPWSFATWLGVTVMLTLSPVIWGVGVYRSLLKFPGPGLLPGAGIIAIVFTLFSVASDYFFFVLIRGAKEALYQPATFYGYAFVFSIPFLEVLFFHKAIIRHKTSLESKDFLLPAILGMGCLTAVFMIIRFKISL